MNSLKKIKKIIILQHPQEPGHPLSSAWLAKETLGSELCELRVGLSWPNLKKATGIDGALPANWLVFYLGGKLSFDPAAYLGAGRSGRAGKDIENAKHSLALNPAPVIVPVSQRSLPLPAEEAVKRLSLVQGLIFLDGTWSQAKTLWWRNAWLLKCPRAVLLSSRVSLYGKMRKEPRRECLSTLESVGGALTALGEDPAVEESLLSQFEGFLKKNLKTE